MCCGMPSHRGDTCTSSGPDGRSSHVYSVPRQTYTLLHIGHTLLATPPCADAGGWSRTTCNRNLFHRTDKNQTFDNIAVTRQDVCPDVYSQVVLPVIYWVTDRTWPQLGRHVLQVDMHLQPLFLVECPVTVNTLVALIWVFMFPNNMNFQLSLTIIPYNFLEFLTLHHFSVPHTPHVYDSCWLISNSQSQAFTHKE